MFKHAMNKIKMTVLQDNIQSAILHYLINTHPHYSLQMFISSITDVNLFSITRTAETLTIRRAYRDSYRIILAWSTRLNKQ